MSASGHASSSAEIAQAVAVLKRGGLVAFPTETVYGLGADASNPQAVARIYAVKGRPANHPVIVHIADLSQLPRWASEIPEAAKKLAARFWPGPLTLVLKRAGNVGDYLTGGQDTIGLRIPGHPLALALLREFGGGVAAPSANRFGRISPTTARHVRDDLGGEVDVILDGGACEVGIESTIIDLSRGRPVLLRPGRISSEEIAAAIGAAPEQAGAEAPRAPGAMESHYAPRTPLKLIRTESWDELGAMSRCGVLAFRAQPPGDSSRLWIAAEREPERYAQALYANLRALDACDCETILVETPPEKDEWFAVNDRLRRAARVA